VGHDVVMAHRLILWDVDGTLVSTGPVGRRALEAGAAQAAGLSEVPQVSMSGKTDPQIVSEILALAGRQPEDIAALVPVALGAAERLLAGWRGRIAAQGHLQPGVRPLLEALAATEGVRQTLLTGNVEPNAFVKVDVFGLAPYFDFAIGAYGSDHADRDLLVPLALERAARLRGDRFRPQEAWVVGDTGNDLRCARAGGARCLLVRTGRQGIGPLGTGDPDHLFDDLSDTERVLDVLVS
jgi:phosphoglycolate phosphatase